jgi:DNA-binding response OmpR family regulator
MLHPNRNVSGPSRVLLLDDDAQIRNLLRTVLSQGDYQVLAASNGEEALQISDRCASTIHILVTDVEIGALNGFELFTRIRQQRPTIPVLFISGNIDVSRTFPRSRSFLEKPFTNPVFLDRVASLLHQTKPFVPVSTPLVI